jgi:limonene-1,2-epoxide hydrolase
MAFLAMLEKPGGFADGVRAFFTEQTNYQNVGMSDTTGIEETLGFLDQFEAATGISYLEIDMLAIAETGNKVLTERIDRLYAVDGSLIMAPPVMGVFEVADGKLIAWRDYFDTAAAAGGH